MPPAADADPAPAVANGVVYMASNDGSVFALNARTGGKLWRRFIGDPVGSSPTVCGWGGLHRLERHLRLCLQPEVTDRRERTQVDSKLPGLKMLQLRVQTVRVDRDVVRRGACRARTDNCRNQAISLKTPAAAR